jgi:hypothetical protein
VWHGPKKSEKLREKKEDPSHSSSSPFQELVDGDLIKLLEESHKLIANPDMGLHLDREERKEKELIDRWGMIFTSKERKNQAESARVVSVKKEAQRERIWLDMIDSWDKLKAEKLKARARKGVPDSLRGMVWPRFSGAQAMMEAEGNRGVYQDLVSRKADMGTEVQLRKDITRTFPKHVFFKNVAGEKGTGNGQEDNGEQYSKGQLSLFNVLKAFALRNPEIGYCQGMGSPCGSFLMYMPEELAFWMMDRFLVSDKYQKFGNLYIDGFPLLFQFFFIYERLFQKFLPKLYQHFTESQITTMTYATKWFQLMYSEFPRETVLIIWDIFFCEGTKILFRVAIALLQLKERVLLRAGQMELMEILRDLPSDPDVADTHTLLSLALKVDVTKKELVKIEGEYAQMLAGQ